MAAYVNDLSISRHQIQSMTLTRGDLETAHASVPYRRGLTPQSRDTHLILS